MPSWMPYKLQQPPLRWYDTVTGDSTATCSDAETPAFCVPTTLSSVTTFVEPAVPNVMSLKPITPPEARRPQDASTTNRFTRRSVQPLSTPRMAPFATRNGPVNVLPLDVLRTMTVFRPVSRMPPSSPSHAGSCRNWRRNSRMPESKPTFSHSEKSKIAPAAPT